MDMLLTKSIILDKNADVIGNEISFFMPYAEECKVKSVTPQFLVNVIIQKIQLLAQKNMLFLNFSDTFLLDVLPFKFSKDNLVVVLSDKIKPDRFILECLARLQNDGYSVMLGDFLTNSNIVPFVEYANIFKINIHDNKLNEIKSKYAPLLNKEISYFASNVSSFEEYVVAQQNDYKFYQGDFLLKPSMLNAEKCRFLQFLTEILAASNDISQLIIVMKKHLFLKDIFLNFVNSRFIHRSDEQLLTINHAAAFIGNIEMTRWLFISSIRSVVCNKPREVFYMTLSRARFCELLSGKISSAKIKFNFFLAGIFSTMDAMLDVPINYIVSELPIAESVKAVLYSDYIINDVYELSTSYERGEWTNVKCYLINLGLSYNDLFECYQEALKWADEYIDCLEVLEKKYKRESRVL